MELYSIFLEQAIALLSAFISVALYIVASNALKILAEVPIEPPHTKRRMRRLLTAATVLSIFAMAFATSILFWTIILAIFRR